MFHRNFKFLHNFLCCNPLKLFIFAKNQITFFMNIFAKNKMQEQSSRTNACIFIFIIIQWKYQNCPWKEAKSQKWLITEFYDK